MSANAAELMNPDVSPKRHVILDNHVASERRPVGEDHVIADVTVVRDMRLRHEKIVRADLGQASAALGAAVQRNELAKYVALAGAKPASLIAILQIVRRLTRGHERKKNRAAAKLRWAFDDTMAGNANVVVQDDVVSNDRVGADRNVASELSFRAYDCGGVNRHCAAFS